MTTQDSQIQNALGGLPPLKDIVAAHQLMAKKNLGQNFLLDSHITDKIARLAGPCEGAGVIEIGPGPGGLTRSLLMAGAPYLLAVERDERFAPILQEIQNKAAGRFQFICQDALTLDLASLAGAHDQHGLPAPPWRIIANLPYNIATPLLLGWLKQLEFIKDMALMFQAEVAMRLYASPSSSAYGRLAVMTQLHCEVSKLMDLSPQAFSPPPKVSSQVVLLTPLREKQIPFNFTKLEKITALAFGQRRKMLRRSLSSFGEAGRAALADCGIDETKRAEQITPADFAALSLKLS